MEQFYLGYPNSSWNTTTAGGYGPHFWPGDQVQTFLKAYLIIVCKSLTGELYLTWKIWSWQWKMPILYTLVKYKDIDIDVGVGVDVYSRMFLMLKFTQGFEAEV